MTSIKNISSHPTTSLELTSRRPKDSLLQAIATGVLVDILAMAGPEAAHTVARRDRSHNATIWQARSEGYLNDVTPAAVAKVFTNRSQRALDAAVSGAIARWATHTQMIAENLTGDMTAKQQTGTIKELRAAIKTVETLWGSMSSACGASCAST